MDAAVWTPIAVVAATSLGPLIHLGSKDRWAGVSLRCSDGRRTCPMDVGHQLGARGEDVRQEPGAVAEVLHGGLDRRSFVEGFDDRAP
jgi:hypothetical protein